MSSAILYLAIIAIWACVLIPRWLRRDSAHEVPAPAPAPVAAEPDMEAEDGLPEDGSPEGGSPEDAGEAAAPAWVAEPPSAERARRRMLAARRRLLLMLIGLEIAAITLAALRLAAIWVVVPPSVMLVGYLLLLREAAQADAERARHEAEAEAAAAARAGERERARRAQARTVTPVDGASTEGIAEAAAALGAKFAAAPVPAGYEDSGRDFAPGLAGKYTTSNADAEPEPAEAAGDHYEPYDPTRLRAVGD
ncbi:MAG TPA: hypothetical protein VFO01_04130 [Trebonia sp.]|nr:hypothetical protein [Trebonia sp.]